MKQDISEEPSQEQYSLVENLQRSFADPSLTQETLRENGCVLAEEYTTILQQLVQLAAFNATTQKKLLHADLKIQKQQEQLQEKNACLEREIAEHVALKKQLQQQTQELTAMNKRLIKTVDELTQRRAEQLRQGIESLAVKMYDEEHTVTASLGVALFPEHGTTIKGVIRAADCALYRAKDKGRNKVLVAA